MYKTTKYRLNEINDYLPETEFIAVFGTSHSSGVCRRGLSQELDKPDIWSERISDLPVVNLSLEGNSNVNMLQQMADFLKTKRSSLCKQIISEVRINEGTLGVSIDALADLDKMARLSGQLSVSSGYDLRDVKNHHNEQKFPRDTVHALLNVSLPVTLLRQGKNAITDYLTGLHPTLGKGDIDPGMAKIVHEWITHFQQNIRPTLTQTIADYRLISLMCDMATIANKDFNWFCWDETSALDMTDENYRIARRLFDSTTNIFEKEIPSLKYSAKTKWKQEGHSLEDIMCDCGHNTEPMHHFVGEKVKGFIHG